MDKEFGQLHAELLDNKKNNEDISETFAKMHDNLLKRNNGNDVIKVLDGRVLSIKDSKEKEEDLLAINGALNAEETRKERELVGKNKRGEYGL